MKGRKTEVHKRLNAIAEIRYQIQQHIRDLEEFTNDELDMRPELAVDDEQHIAFMTWFPKEEVDAEQMTRDFNQQYQYSRLKVDFRNE